jgi:hypothetical protein
MLAMVAGYAGLDPKREFSAVLDVVHAIAGEPSVRVRSPLIRRRVGAKPMHLESGAARAGSVWNGLARRSRNGECYASARGVNVEEVIARDVVRFFGNGDPGVALRSLGNGEVINVVRRRQVPGPDGPKVFGLRGCPTLGSLCGAVGDISEGADVCVITEGVFDTLVAISMWPSCTVLGAHGAGRLASVAAAAAPIVVGLRGWLVIVPHVDCGAGERAAVDACIEARRHGLTLDETLHLVDVLPWKDLADAQQGGWRHGWPS